MMREIGNTCQNKDVTLRWLLPTLGEANLTCSWGMAKTSLAPGSFQIQFTSIHHI